MNNNFDIVMSYIDAHITESTEDIKKGIWLTIGYSSKVFGDCFTVLTGQTLFHYIGMRKLYFAAKELIENRDRTICDIALEYGYSEQSAFTRAMKAFWNATPSDIRRGDFHIPENRYTLRGISVPDSNKAQTRTQRILHDLESKGTLSPLNWELFGELEQASDNYGFDIDTCYEIVDLAEKIGVPPKRLLSSCYEETLKSELEEELSEKQGLGLSEKERLCIMLDLDSKELEDVCQFFECQYYDLDEAMVDIYMKHKHDYINEA